jgi:hypothetical protein
MYNVLELIGKMIEGYEEKCVELGIIQRKREIGSPRELMLLNLHHLVNGCSLIEISTLGKLLEIGNFSDVAYMKKFEKCGAWFTWISEQVMEQAVINYEKPAYLAKYRVIATDASDILSKGRNAQNYRLHYAVDIFKMCCVYRKVTYQTYGETLKNFDISKGDLVVADRIYGTINGISHCLNSEADYILRLRTNCFKIYDESKKEIDILAEFADLGCEESASITGYVKEYSTGNFISVRICAKRKSEEAITHSREKLRRRATDKQHKLSPRTEIFNDYTIVATSLPNEVSDSDIFETYRYRWQIEMYFKRLKSIMNIGDLPKKREDAVLAWLNGKIMVALLIESVLADVSFSPC